MKKFLAILLAVIIAVSLAACGVDGSDNDKETKTKSSASKDAKDEGNEDDTKEATKDSDETTTQAAVSAVLTEKDPIVVENTAEFYLDYTEITKRVLPPKSGDGWYSYYDADEGTVYVNVCVAYKNLDTYSIGADEVIGGQLIYDGKYNYRGFSMIEKDNRSNFTYTNITSIAPLQTDYIHYLFKIPEEAQANDKSIEIVLNIAGSDYKVVVR